MKGFLMFVKKHWQIAALVCVLALVGGFGFSRCSKEDRQDFEKNARIGVRVAAAAAVEINEEVKSYCRAELLKPESCEKALPHTKKIADVAQRIDRFLKEHPKITPENREQLLGAADEIVGELDALEAEGVIEFKDPDKRRQFLLGLAVSRSTLRVAKVALQEMPAEPSPTPEQ